MNNVCKHGQLRRQCDLCEKDNRIVDLEQQLEEMRAMGERSARDWKSLLAAKNRQLAEMQAQLDDLEGQVVKMRNSYKIMEDVYKARLAEMQAQLDEVDRKLVESALRLQFEQHRTLVQSGDRRSAIVRNTREEIATEADITPLSSRVHLPEQR